MDHNQGRNDRLGRLRSDIMVGVYEPKGGIPELTFGQGVANGRPVNFALTGYRKEDHLTEEDRQRYEQTDPAAAVVTAERRAKLLRTLMQLDYEREPGAQPAVMLRLAAPDRSPTPTVKRLDDNRLAGRSDDSMAVEKFYALIQDTSTPLKQITPGLYIRDSAFLTECMNRKIPVPRVFWALKWANFSKIDIDLFRALKEVCNSPTAEKAGKLTYLYRVLAYGYVNGLVDVGSIHKRIIDNIVGEKNSFWAILNIDFFGEIFSYPSCDLKLEKALDTCRAVISNSEQSGILHLSDFVEKGKLILSEEMRDTCKDDGKSIAQKLRIPEKKADTHSGKKAKIDRDKTKASEVVKPHNIIFHADRFYKNLDINELLKPFDGLQSKCDTATRAQGAKRDTVIYIYAICTWAVTDFRSFSPLKGTIVMTVIRNMLVPSQRKRMFFQQPLTTFLNTFVPASMTELNNVVMLFSSLINIKEFSYMQFLRSVIAHGHVVDFSGNFVFKFPMKQADLLMYYAMTFPLDSIGTRRQKAAEPPPTKRVRTESKSPLPGRTPVSRMAISPQTAHTPGGQSYSPASLTPGQARRKYRRPVYTKEEQEHERTEFLRYVGISPESENESEASKHFCHLLYKFQATDEMFDFSKESTAFAHLSYYDRNLIADKVLKQWIKEQKRTVASLRFMFMVMALSGRQPRVMAIVIETMDQCVAEILGWESVKLDDPDQIAVIKLLQEAVSLFRYNIDHFCTINSPETKGKLEPLNRVIKKLLPAVIEASAPPQQKKVTLRINTGKTTQRRVASAVPTGPVLTAGLFQADTLCRNCHSLLSYAQDQKAAFKDLEIILDPLPPIPEFFFRDPKGIENIFTCLKQYFAGKVSEEGEFLTTSVETCSTHVEFLPPILNFICSIIDKEDEMDGTVFQRVITFLSMLMDACEKFSVVPFYVLNTLKNGQFTCVRLELILSLASTSAIISMGMCGEFDFNRMLFGSLRPLLHNFDINNSEEEQNVTFDRIATHIRAFLHFSEHQPAFSAFEQYNQMNGCSIRLALDFFGDFCHFYKILPPGQQAYFLNPSTNTEFSVALTGFLKSYTLLFMLASHYTDVIKIFEQKQFTSDTCLKILEPAYIALPHWLKELNYTTEVIPLFTHEDFADNSKPEAQIRILAGALMLPAISHEKFPWVRGFSLLLIWCLGKKSSSITLWAVYIMMVYLSRVNTHNFPDLAELADTVCDLLHDTEVKQAEDVVCMTYIDNLFSKVVEAPKATFLESCVEHAPAALRKSPEIDLFHKKVLLLSEFLVGKKPHDPAQDAVLFADVLCSVAIMHIRSRRPPANRSLCKNIALCIDEFTDAHANDLRMLEEFLLPFMKMLERVALTSNAARYLSGGDSENFSNMAGIIIGVFDKAPCLCGSDAFISSVHRFLYTTYTSLGKQIEWKGHVYKIIGGLKLSWEARQMLADRLMPNCIVPEREMAMPHEQPQTSQTSANQRSSVMTSDNQNAFLYYPPMRFVESRTVIELPPQNPRIRRVQPTYGPYPKPVKYQQTPTPMGYSSPHAMRASHAGSGQPMGYSSRTHTPTQYPSYFSFHP